MSDIIPVFKSHYSLSRSILTLAPAGKSKPTEPRSIFDIAKNNNLSEVFMVDSVINGFLEAYQNAEKSKINLRFGVKLTVCDDTSKKDEESLINEHNIIVFFKNIQGYKDFIKIYSKAHVDNYYYVGRTSYKELNEMWTDNLLAAVPFYDSFLYKNITTFASIIPNFGHIKPIFFLENMDLPLDQLIRDRVINYCNINKFDIQETHSIYYENRADFKEYLVFRCINKRSTFNCPNLDGMCSNNFCFEAYKEKLNA